MKKLLFALFLSVSLLLFITGCGSTSNETTEVVTDDETTTTDTSNLAEEIIGSWNNTSEEDGVGEVSFTYTFNEDGTYTLQSDDQNSTDTDSKTGSHQISGTYEVNDDQLLLTPGNSDSVSSDSETSAETLAEDVVSDEQEYTITISGDELTLTNSLNDSIVYKRVNN